MTDDPEDQEWVTEDGRTLEARAKQIYERAGLAEAEAIRWADEGFEPYATQSRLELGVSLEDSVLARDLGMGVVEIRSLLGLGMQIGDIARWVGAGVLAGEAVRALELGLSIEEYALWRSIGADLVDIEWAESHGLSTDDFSLQAPSFEDLSSAGATAELVHEWLGEGLALEVCLSLLAQNTDPNLISNEAAWVHKWLGEGLALEVCLSLLAQNTDPNLISNEAAWHLAVPDDDERGSWRYLRVGHKEAAQLRDQGFTVQDAALGVDEGADLEESVRLVVDMTEPFLTRADDRQLSRRLATLAQERRPDPEELRRMGFLVDEQDRDRRFRDELHQGILLVTPAADGVGLRRLRIRQLSAEVALESCALDGTSHKLGSYPALEDAIGQLAEDLAKDEVSVSSIWSPDRDPAEVLGVVQVLAGAQPDTIVQVADSLEMRSVKDADGAWSFAPIDSDQWPSGSEACRQEADRNAWSGDVRSTLAQRSDPFSTSLAKDDLHVPVLLMSRTGYTGRTTMTVVVRGEDGNLELRRPHKPNRALATKDLLEEIRSSRLLREVRPGTATRLHIDLEAGIQIDTVLDVLSVVRPDQLDEPLGEWTAGDYPAGVDELLEWMDEFHHSWIGVGSRLLEVNGIPVVIAPVQNRRRPALILLEHGAWRGGGELSLREEWASFSLSFSAAMVSGDDEYSLGVITDGVIGEIYHVDQDNDQLRCHVADSRGDVAEVVWWLVQVCDMTNRGLGMTNRDLAMFAAEVLTNSSLDLPVGSSYFQDEGYGPMEEECYLWISVPCDLDEFFSLIRQLGREDVADAIQKPQSEPAKRRALRIESYGQN